jgi:hypothetical protein
VADDVDNIGPDYVTRVISATAPEVADRVVGIEIVEEMLQIVQSLEERIEPLSLMAGVEREKGASQKGCSRNEGLVWVAKPKRLPTVPEACRR